MRRGGRGRRAEGVPSAAVASGETTAPTDDGDDLAARLADPVLVAARDDAPVPTAPPDVWGALAPSDGRSGRTDPLDDRAVEARARDLVDEMTLHEKLHLLSGDGPLVRGLSEMARHYNETAYVAGALPRLGLPGIRFSDGPRGVVMGHATAFPVPMARGATFDPELEERVGDVIGVECRALGANLFAGVCVNLLRHPAWGRAQETFGEDPHLLGEMGAATVRGTQRHVMACVKHFACNSMEDARLRVDVSIDDDDLRDIYLPHFRRCIDAGAAAVMTAYNKVNGERCGHHHHLLTEVLKGEWGFDGFVMSDFVFGVRSGTAVAAGQDLEMPFRWRFRSLGRHVRQGTVTAERVDDAARRLVRQQVRFADRTAEPDRPGRYSPAVVASAEHRALAREVAERSMVLLRNERVLVAGTAASGTPTAADERAPGAPARPRPGAVAGRARRPGRGARHGRPRVEPRALAGRRDAARRAAGGRRAVRHQRRPPSRRRPRRGPPGGGRRRRGRRRGRVHPPRRGREHPGPRRRPPLAHAARRGRGAHPHRGGRQPPHGRRARGRQRHRHRVVARPGGCAPHGLVPGHRGGHRPRPPPVRRGRARRPPALHVAARRRAASAVRPRRQAGALRPAARLPADGGDGPVAGLPLRVRPDLHDVRARPDGGQAGRRTARCASPSPW